MLKRLGLCLIAVAGIAAAAHADDYVKDYTKKDGTYVPGHYRSSPNSTVRDNFSYRGKSQPVHRGDGPQPLLQLPVE